MPVTIPAGLTVVGDRMLPWERIQTMSREPFEQEVVCAQPKMLLDGAKLSAQKAHQRDSRRDVQHNGTKQLAHSRKLACRPHRYHIL